MPWLKLSRLVSQRRNRRTPNTEHRFVFSSPSSISPTPLGGKFWTNNFARFLYVSDTNPRIFVIQPIHDCVYCTRNSQTVIAELYFSVSIARAVYRTYVDLISRLLTLFVGIFCKMLLG